MSKFKFGMVPAAVALLVAAGSASAAVVNVTANVQAVACTIAVSKTDINLGSYIPAHFAGATVNATTGAVTPVANSQQDFSVELKDCAGTPEAEAAASVKISGPVVAGSSDRIFNKVTSNVGAVVSLGNAGAVDFTAIQNGQKVEIAKAAPATPAPGPQLTDYNNKSIVMRVGLATTAADVATVQTGLIDAPITLDFMYN
ncbi:hypothetical protein [Serratia microhaemolytica]|uniref:hypothetical protein n=1 Tax=Serratia microhaemolytica TaxID=2675110 RepID=UPI000FDF0A30|nr:hypothetical protein [Serratia microhaemolytica]